MTSILVIEGPGAERAAAVRIRDLVAGGARVRAARAGGPADARLPVHAREFVTASGDLLPNETFGAATTAFNPVPERVLLLCFAGRRCCG